MNINTLIATQALLLAFSVTWLASPAAASSMPKADLSGNTLSMGSAPSLALDMSLTPQWALGFSTAMPFYYGAFGFLRYDVRSTYALLQTDSLTVRGVFGVFGDLDPWQRETLQLSPIGLEAGMSLAYRMHPLVMLRVNFVAGIGFPRSTGWGLFPPGGGIELAFKPFEQFEVTAGFNGNGDIFAVRYLF